MLHRLDPPLIHRDIKPENILVDTTAGLRVSLIDLGTIQPGLKSKLTTAGSFAYMAPEQLHGSAVLASDQYGLGMTLIELLSGGALAHLPRQGLYVELEQAVRVSEGFRHWLEHLVAPYPEQRFASVAAAREALRAPEYLKSVSPRSTMKAVHNKQSLTPHVWLEETPTTLILETNGSQVTLAHILKYLSYVAFYFLVPAITSYGMYRILSWGGAGFQVSEMMAFGSYALLLIMCGIPLFLRSKKMSQKHRLLLNDEHLEHTYIYKQGVFGRKKKHYVYPRDNIKSIKLSTTEISVKRSGSWRDLTLLLLTVPLPPEARQRLTIAFEKKGVQAYD